MMIGAMPVGLSYPGAASVARLVQHEGPRGESNVGTFS